MDKNQKPKHFLVLKILGFTSLLLGILLIILGVTILKGSVGSRAGTIVPGAFLIFLTIPFLVYGFADKIFKATIKTTRYIQQENEEDLKDISDGTADMFSGAITKTAKAVKKGIKTTMFCKHCGAEIDFDSKFCNRCGKEQ